jgi:hypothetical protein
MPKAADMSYDPFDQRSYADPSKALVMAKVGELVRNGLANWTVLENGDIELRLATGEVLHLGRTTVMQLDRLPPEGTEKITS